MSLFSPGRRWLSAASLTMMVVAGLHTAGQFGAEPREPHVAEALAAMRTARLPMGAGMVPSIFDIFRSLTFTMSVTVLALGALGLAVSADREASTRLLRRVAGLLALCSLALTGLYAFYQVPPALVSFVVVSALYVVAAFKAFGR